MPARVRAKRKQVPLRRFRPAAWADLGAVCDMIEPVFWEAVAPACTPEGWQVFGRLVSEEALAARLTRGAAGFVAVEGEAIVGYAEMTPANHLLLLFTALSVQRQGVARSLLVLCAAEQPDRAITVNATPGAVGAYQRLGFAPTGPAFHRNGVTSVPMRRSAAADAEPGLA